MKYIQVFDAENRLKTVQVLNSGVNCPLTPDTELTSGVSATTKFYYDGNGTQVKRLDPGGVYPRYYFGGMYEVHGDGRTIQYYPAGGAMRVTGTGAGLFFILSDHLGSTSVVTDANGGNLTTTGYYPFGGTRYSTGSLPTDRLYTGQQQNSYINLLNYRSRWYDAYITHFIQPDSIIPNQYDPQSLNRYSYVLNNPIRYIDPTGYDAIPFTPEMQFGLAPLGPVGWVILGVIVIVGIIINMPDASMIAPSTPTAGQTLSDAIKPPSEITLDGKPVTNINSTDAFLMKGEYIPSDILNGQAERNAYREAVHRYKAQHHLKSVPEDVCDEIARNIHDKKMKPNDAAEKATPPEEDDPPDEGPGE